MTPHEAGRLLGGYATGTLSETERKELFAAALEDQAIFEALADEEHLRALLEDPGAREQLLVSLGSAPPASRFARPFWLRPAGLGIAATVLVSIGVGLSLRHLPPDETPRSAVPEIKSEPSVTASKSAPKETASDEVATRRRVPVESLPKVPAALPPPPPPPPAPAPVALDGSRAGKSQSFADAVTANEASVQAERQEGKLAAKEERKAAEALVQAAPSKARDFSATAFLAPGAVQVGFGEISPNPTWQLSTQSSGAFLLKVRWSGKGRLTLLQKSSSGELRKAPASTQALDDGRSESVFTGTVAPHDTLDLLQMPARGDDSTPPFQARIWPIKKNETKEAK